MFIIPVTTIHPYFLPCLCGFNGETNINKAFLFRNYTTCICIYTFTLTFLTEKSTLNIFTFLVLTYTVQNTASLLKGLEQFLSLAAVNCKFKSETFFITFETQTTTATLRKATWPTLLNKTLISIE